MSDEEREGEAVNLPEIDDERLPVVGRIQRGSQQVQTFVPTLAQIIDFFGFTEFRVDGGQSRDGENRTESHNLRFAIRQIATLGHHYEIAAPVRDFPRTITPAKIGWEKRDGTFG